jgi:hypothetical protein
MASSSHRPGAIRATRRLAGGALVATLALPAVLTATSGVASASLTSKSPVQIVAAAATAARDAKSFLLAGTEHESGKTVHIHTYATSTGNGYGTITYGNIPIQLVQIGSTSYIKTTSAFWVQEGSEASEAAKLANHWIETGANGSGGFDQFFNTHLVASTFNSKGVTFSKDGSSTVNGHKVILIEARKGTSKTVIAIAATGTPYPLEEVAHAGSDGGTLYLSAFNQPVHVTAPSGAVPLG